MPKILRHSVAKYYNKVHNWVLKSAFADRQQRSEHRFSNGPSSGPAQHTHTHIYTYIALVLKVKRCDRIFEVALKLSLWQIKVAAAGANLCANSFTFYWAHCGRHHIAATAYDYVCKGRWQKKLISVKVYLMSSDGSGSVRARRVS